MQSAKKRVVQKRDIEMYDAKSHDILVCVQARLLRSYEREAQGAEKGSAVRNGRAYCYGRAVNRVAPDERAKLQAVACHIKSP